VAYGLEGGLLTPSNSSLNGLINSQSFVVLHDTNGDIALVRFAVPLTDAGGVVAVLTGPDFPGSGAIDLYAGLFDYATSGTVEGDSAVPEPGYAPLAAIVVGLALARRRGWAG